MNKVLRGILVVVPGGLAILSIVAQILLSDHEHHDGPPFETLPGFFGLFGFLGALLLLALSLGLGKAFLRKKERYDEDD